MSEPLLSIGTFSRAASLSVKTLRAYHAQGLLTPAAVDPETGFRRYAAGQLADAAVIRRLRDLEVPLADVATILAARDPEVTAATLARHADQMRERARRVEQIVQDLHAAPPETWTPPRLVELPATSAVAVTGVVRDSAYDAFLVAAYARLEEGCRGRGRRGHRAGVRPVRRGVPRRRRAGGHGVLPGPGAGRPSGHDPAAAAAGDGRGRHPCRGPRDPARHYGLLGAWVAQHGTPSGQPLREAYVANVSDSVPPSAYQTDIVWPLIPRKDTP